MISTFRSIQPKTIFLDFIAFSGIALHNTNNNWHEHGTFGVVYVPDCQLQMICQYLNGQLALVHYGFCLFAQGKIPLFTEWKCQIFPETASTFPFR